MRDFDNYRTVYKAIMGSGIKVSEVVTGGGRGVEALGERWARQQNIPVKEFPALWNVHGVYAPRERNREMLIYADALIAVWDGKWADTRSVIKMARSVGMTVYVHRIKRRQAPRAPNAPDKPPLSVPEFEE